MTSVVTTVRYGTRARALVRSHAVALPGRVPVTDVARFVARASAEEDLLARAADRGGGLAHGGLLATER